MVTVLGIDVPGEKREGKWGDSGETGRIGERERREGWEGREVKGRGNVTPMVIYV